ncbi:MAG: DUF3168 domain-containing protein [Pseudomonadota bacterium]
MINLLTAIMSKITTGPSALSSDVGGRIFLDQAPDGVEFPYVVFFIVSGIPDDVFAKKGRSILIQFSLFSASAGATEITTIYRDLKALFDECAMTIPPTGTETDKLVWMKRTNLTTMVEEITVADATQTVKHWAVDFEVVTQEV